MVTVYLVPIISHLENGVLLVRDPKYVSYGQDWQCVPYGAENICILGVENITPDLHNTIAAASDSFVVLGLDSQIGDTTAFELFLEAHNIPADWLNSVLQWRVIIKILIAIFEFGNKWEKIAGGSSPFADGLTLATRGNQLDAPTLEKINQCFDEIGLDRSGIKGADTLRKTLFAFGSQYMAREIKLQGVIL